MINCRLFIIEISIGIQAKSSRTGLTKRAVDIQKGIIPPRKGRRNNDPSNMLQLMENYKTTTHYITPQTDFIRLFDQYFPNKTQLGSV